MNVWHGPDPRLASSDHRYVIDVEVNSANVSPLKIDVELHFASVSLDVEVNSVSVSL